VCVDRPVCVMYLHLSRSDIGGAVLGELANSILMNL